MIPPAESSIWRKIVKGQLPITSQKLAINLLVKNVSLSYENDPSQENVEMLAGRAHEFFVKYESTFAEEFKRILG